MVIGVNGLAALLIIVLVAAVALVFNPPAPPSIAEFAPQAAKTINKAPPNQNSSIGAAGACVGGLGQVCHGGPPTQKHHAQPSLPPAPSLPPKPIGVPSALQCFTWPDGSVTQTFDPQSPPCVATWPDQAKGNGGATSPGVTDTEIRVGIPQDTDPATTRVKYLKPYIDYVDPFGELRTLPEYTDTLADEKIISLGGGNMSNLVPSGDLEAHAPYAWTYTPVTGDLWTATGSLICRQLARHNATHSSAYRTTPRKFAILLPDPSSDVSKGTPNISPDNLISEMTSCGLPKPQVLTYYNDPKKDEPALIQLKNEGVTSLIYYAGWGESNATGAPTNAAAHVAYYPEWINPGWFSFNAAGLAASEATEVNQIFGIGTWNKLPSPTTSFWSQAWVQGGGDPTQLPYLDLVGEAFYHELLLLASGVQMAGAHLTPQSFADALHRTQFPNPGAGGPPFYQAAVGFPGTSVTMMRDLVAWWLDPRNANQSNSGTTATYWTVFCYADIGQRWGVTDWPSKDVFFGRECR